MPGSLRTALTKCHWGHAANNDSKHGKWLHIIASFLWPVVVGQPGLWKTWHTTTDWCTHNHAASIYAFKGLIYIFVVIKFARKSLSGAPYNTFCGLAQAAPRAADDFHLWYKSKFFMFYSQNHSISPGHLSYASEMSVSRGSVITHGTSQHMWWKL